MNTASKTTPTSLKQIVAQKANEAQEQAPTPLTPANQVTVKRATNNNLSVFADIDSFQAAQRMAHALASADFTPETFKGKVANCLLALEMANRINSSVVAVMQNLYIVKGKPAWSGKYVIGAINTSGRFQTSLLYDMEYDEKTKKPIACTAFAYDKMGNKLEGPKVTMDMAKGEGWTSNPKWTTMPDLMFRYRSASFFGNTYVPDILMGMKTVEEVEDMSYAQLSSPQNLSSDDSEVDLAEAMNAIDDAHVSAPSVVPTTPEAIDAIIEEAPSADAPIETATPSSVAPINGGNVNANAQPTVVPIEFDMPATLDDLRMLIVDLSLTMEIKDNGKGQSYAGVKGVSDPAKADVLVQIGFKTKGDTFVLDVTEFVLQEQAEDLF